MGIGKKVVLASLISMMMILAFMIGLVPSHRAPSAAAASGDIDVGRVFGALLGVKAVEAPVIVSPPDGLLVRVPETLTDSVYLRLRAEVPAGSDVPDSITLALDGEGAPGPGWSGDMADTILGPPYALDVDLTTLMQASATHWVYAFANAVENEGKASLVYDPNLMDFVSFDVELIDASVVDLLVDVDGNGIPDNLLDAFLGVGANQMWISRNASGALVIVANLDNGADKALYDLDGVTLAFENVQVEAPSRAALEDAGLLMVGDEAFILVELGSNLTELTEDADLAADVAALQPGGLLDVDPVPGTLRQYAEISLVYTTDGVAWYEIEDLSAAPVRLTMTSILGAQPVPATFLSYSSTVSATEPLTYAVDADSAWLEENAWGVLADGSLSVDLTSLCVLAPFGAVRDIYSVTPDRGSTAGGGAVGIATTSFPAGADLNTVAEAAAAYAVYFDDTLAEFYDGAVPVVNANAMYVVVPPHVAGTVSICVADRIYAGLTTYLTDGYTYVAPPAITDISPSTGSPSGGDVVTITGTSLLETTSVTFAGIPGTGLAVLSDTQVTVVTPAQDAGDVVVVLTTPYGTAEGDFSYVSEPGTLLITVYPTGAGTTTPAAGVLHTYPAGEEVVLTAAEEDGWVFKGWVLPDFGWTTDNPTTLAIAGEVQTNVGAIFEAVEDALTLTELAPTAGPAAGGTPVWIGGFFPVAADLESVEAAAAAYKVYFGDTLAAFDSSVPAIVTATSMYVITPAHAAGTVDVRVEDATDPENYDVLANWFTYLGVPSLTSVDPNQGPVEGGTFVVITGQNLATARAVYFGPVGPGTLVPQLSVESDEQLTALTPPGTAGPVDVTVVTDGGEDTLNDGYTYVSGTTWSLTISVSPVGSGATVPPEGIYAYADATVVNVSAQPNSGWQFDHWLLGGAPAGSTMPLSVYMDANKAVTAVFVEEVTTFTLTTAVSPAGSGTISPAAGAHEYAEGTDVDVTATANSGWAFDQWLVDGVESGSDMPLTVTMDADKTVTAVFVEEITFTLTTAVSPAGSGTISPAAGTHEYAEGTDVDVTATANSGWAFDQWLVDGVESGSDMPLTVTMDADKAVTAVFVEATTFTLTTAVSPLGSGTIDPAAGTHVYAADTDVDVTAAANSGWTFDHWMVDGVESGSDMPLTVTMDADKTVTAVFAGGVTFALTTAVSPVGSGTIDPAAGTHVYAADTDVDVTATANSGWTFDHWLVDGVESGSDMPLTVTMDADKAVTAVFTGGISYTLTTAVSPVGSGTIDPAAGTHTYAADTVVDVTATGNDNWFFDYWTVNGVDTASGSAATLSVTMDADKTVTAVFGELGPLAVTPDEAWLFGGSVVTVSGGGFTSKTSVKFGDVSAPVIARTSMELLVIVPVLADAPEDEDSVTVDVTVTVASGAHADELAEFTYYRHKLVGDVMVTSFIHDHVAAKTTDEEEVIAADIKLDDTQSAALTLPVGANEVNSDVYGLARASLSPETALSTDVITNALGAQTLVDGEWGIDIHLYTMEGQPNVQGLVEGSMIYTELTDWAYPAGDANPGRIAIPLSAGLLTAKSVRDGLSLETAAYELDYVTLAEGTDPAMVQIDAADRRIRRQDVEPRVVPFMRNVRPLTAVNARVFALGALSIRVKAVPDVNPCFIATAAYGTPMAAEIDTLRGLRDTFMLNNAAGAAFVDMYYRVSPAFAAVVAKSPVLAAIVRVVLTPVIWLAEITLAAPSSVLLAASAAMAALVVRRRRRACSKA